MVRISEFNPNEITFLDDQLAARIESNHTDESDLCRSPEQILADLEELYECPLIFLITR